MSMFPAELRAYSPFRADIVPHKRVFREYFHNAIQECGLRRRICLSIKLQVAY